MTPERPYKEDWIWYVVVFVMALLLVISAVAVEARSFLTGVGHYEPWAQIDRDASPVCSQK